MKQNTRLANQYLGFMETPSLFIDDAITGYPCFELYSDNNIPIFGDRVPPNLMLGKRAELFFEDAVKQSTRYELLAKNLQIQKEKLTIGELDFLIENRYTKEHLHVELVYKFYLYDPNLGKEELNRWIGPNRNDSLLQKLKKLKNKQFPLLLSEEAKKLLNSRELEVSKMKQRLCFKAQLFVPLELVGKQIPKINNECITGHWISADEFTAEKYGDLKFFVPEKQDWFIEPTKQTEWLSYKETTERFNPQLKAGKSPLVWMNGADDSFAKLFLVWW